MPTIDAAVLSKVSVFLSEHQIDTHARIAVAFSGGSDSLALLLALAKMHDPAHLHAMYVQHHLRPVRELEAEMALNMQNCERIGVCLHVLDLGSGSVHKALETRKAGVEEAARYLRYQALYTQCRLLGCAYLATAHNADDQLETTLMRLFQGGSISSLEGVRSVRPVDEHQLTLIRPVLACSHAELADFVTQHAMQWSEDSSNSEDAYLRNTIRHTITPAILSVFGGAYDAVAQMSNRFGNAGRVLDALTDDCMQAVSFSCDCAVFSRSWYRKLDPALRELVLYRIVSRFMDGQRVSGAFIQRMQTALETSDDDRNWVLESGPHSFRLDSDACTYHMAGQPIQHFCMPLVCPSKEQTLELGNDILFCIHAFGQKQDSSLLALDASQLEDPVLRSVQLSDEICLEGGTVKVTKLLASYKIPKHLHPTVPVLVDRSGVVAVFARVQGGRDRLAKRFKAPLAHGMTNIYSSNKRNNCSEIEKRQPR